MRRVAVAFIFVLFTVALLAKKTPETLEELKARAEQAKPQDQVGLFLEVAKRQLETADAAYSSGDPDHGKAAIDDVALYAEKAGAAAVQTGKHLKNTEIELRKMEDKIEAIRRSVEFESRPPLQSAGDRLEKVRTELLNRMFKGKH